MSLTKELLEAIKDENLSKEQLEDYYTKICQLRSDLSLAIAELVKKEAVFMGEPSEKSVASIKIDWKKTAEGQKLIEYKGLYGALSNAKDGIKNRIYSKL